MTTTELDGIVEQYLSDLDEALAGLAPARRRQLVDDVRSHVEESRVGLAGDDVAGVREILERIGDPEAIAAEALAVDDEDGRVAAPPPPGGHTAPPPPVGPPGWSPVPPPGAPPMGRGWATAEAFVPALLLFGGFLFVVGWFVGAFMLLASPTWRVRDKLLGILVVPGGLAGIVVLVGLGGATAAQVCTSAPPAVVVGGSAAATVGRVVTHCSGFAFPSPVLGIAVFLVVLVAPVLVAVHLDRVRRRVRQAEADAFAVPGYRA